MRVRLSRPTSGGSRKSFKVDSLLQKKLKEREDSLHPQALNGFMTLTFLGFYDKRSEIYIHIFKILLDLALPPVAGERPLERVGVEVLLVKQAHKRRKESTGALERTALGTSEVPVNPSEDHPPSKAPALSVPSESFSLSEGHQTRSYILVVRVHHSPFVQVGADGHSLRKDQ